MVLEYVVESLNPSGLACSLQEDKANMDGILCSTVFRPSIFPPNMIIIRVSLDYGTSPLSST